MSHEEPIPIDDVLIFRSNGKFDNLTITSILLTERGTIWKLIDGVHQREYGPDEVSIRYWAVCAVRGTSEQTARPSFSNESHRAAASA